MTKDDRIEISPTGGELALFDDISKLAHSLWKKTLAFSGLNTDPKMHSCILFKRLWSNHRGYTLLWNNHLHLESEIILRSALEAAICLSAIVELKEEFILLLKQDAAFTLQGQIKIYRHHDEKGMVREGEQVLRLLQNGLPEGVKAVKLDWKQLAAKGQAPHLYDWHKNLSGISSHVTGLSIIPGFGGEGLDEQQKELRETKRVMNLMIMAGTTLQGSMCHARMIGDNEEMQTARGLAERMNTLSWGWCRSEQPGPWAKL